MLVIDYDSVSFRFCGGKPENQDEVNANQYDWWEAGVDKQKTFQKKAIKEIKFPQNCSLIHL